MEHQTAAGVPGIQKAADQRGQPADQRQKQGGQEKEVAAQQHIVQAGVMTAEDGQDEDEVDVWHKEQGGYHVGGLLFTQQAVQHAVERVLVGVQVGDGWVAAGVDVQLRGKLTDVLPAHVPERGDAVLVVAGIGLHVDAAAQGAGRVTVELQPFAVGLTEEAALPGLLVQPALQGVDLVGLVGHELQHGVSSSLSASRTQRRRRVSSLSYRRCPASVMV